MRFAFFDLDGVLVDSRPGIVRCVNETLVELNCAPLPGKEVEAIIGPPLVDGFATLLERQGVDRHRAGDAVERYRRRYASAAVAGTVLQPGIREMLSHLAEKTALAVATSKPLEFSTPILEALDIARYFEVVAGPTALTDGENKTATLARAVALVERSRTPLERACMIGDRSFDMVAARATGLIAVGATWGFGSETELRAAGAAFLVERPADVPPIVLGDCAA